MIFAIKYTPFYVRISFTAKIKLTIRGLDAERPIHLSFLIRV